MFSHSFAKMGGGAFFATICGALLLPMSAIADSNVIGFWDFKCGNVGDDVGTVTDSSGQWTGTTYKAHATKGTLPTYSSACPDAVIFTDASRSEVCVENPQSLHFSLGSGGNGGYVDIGGLSTELTSHTQFTVEFFARLDDASSNPWTEPLAFRTVDRYASVTFGEGDSTRMKFNYQNVASPSEGAIASTNITEALLNHWIHVAFVYNQTDSESNSGDLKCYVNRKLKYTLAYTNTPLGEVSQPLRLGTTLGTGRAGGASYNFRGDICALRIKSVVLNESGFMLRGYTVPQGAMLGFWDFKDGAVGTSASTVTNKGSIANLDPGCGSAIKGKDTGCVPAFSDDVPGQYIFPSSSKSGKRLVENPQSLLFTTQGAGSVMAGNYQSVGGGMIRFPKLGVAITAQSNYTIECFFKDEDWSQWSWASGLFGFVANDENGSPVNVEAMVSTVATESTVNSKLSPWTVNLSAPINASYTRDLTWKDGKWHHLAVVYNGSATPATMSIYVDHALGQTVSYENHYREDEDFVLGVRADKSSNYTFRGKICCLRIMPTALGIADFMVATDILPGLVIMVR